MFFLDIDEIEKANMNLKFIIHETEHNLLIKIEVMKGFRILY